MRSIYISLVRPSLDYCSQIWGPAKGPLMDKLEKTLKDFTKLCPDIRYLSYEDRLRSMNIQSVQRRFDRYRVIYMKKVQLGLVPNPGVLVESNISARCGFKFNIPHKNSKSGWTSALRKTAFQYRAPRQFNSIPLELRNMTSSMDVFKQKLDVFLRMIPDTPRIGSQLKSFISNDLDAQIQSWDWKIRNGPF